MPSPTSKILICRITEYFRIKPKTTKKVRDLLFSKKYDIEHIHANGDKTKKFPEVLQNSIGNLTMLEYDINRSIKDKVFSEKKKSYKGSDFPTIQDLATLKDWTVEDAEKRREEVVNNIYNYLFS